MTCSGKCTAPPNKGIRATYWCGFKAVRAPKDHPEHDHYDRKIGRWVHCYG